MDAVKITKKIREDAAFICSIAASNPDMYLYQTIRKRFGLSWRAVDLAVYAWVEVRRRPGLMSDAETEAEAEAMLRTGWTP